MEEKKMDECDHKDIKKLSYNERYDCYFCETCDIWCEKNCNDPTCYFCVGRPEKPSHRVKGDL